MLSPLLGLEPEVWLSVLSLRVRVFVCVGIVVFFWICPHMFDSPLSCARARCLDACAGSGVFSDLQVEPAYGFGPVSADAWIFASATQHRS